MKKVFFVQDMGQGNYETESLWCIPSGEHFIVDNIPFVAKRIALGDIISVEYDEEEGVFYFDDFVEVSGNSTIRLYFNEGSSISKAQSELEALGCSTEVFADRLILAVNVPLNIQYQPIKVYLDSGELEKKWEYEEACLAHNN